MIKLWKKIIRYYISIIDWGEILNSVVFILLGLAYSHYYGYQVNGQDFFHICLWYILLKLAVYCLNAIFSGNLVRDLKTDATSKFTLVETDILLVKYFWLVTILLIIMSFIPMVQMISQHVLSKFSFLLITLVYLGELVFFIDRLNNLLYGMNELFYAFINSFLLPALYFSLSRDYIKSSLIIIIFPLFLQLIAWRTSINIDLKVAQKRIPATSVVERAGISYSLNIVEAMLILGSLSLFMEPNLIRFENRIIILPIGLIAAWLVFRSVRKQTPNWERAMFLIRMLPLMSIVSMLASLWNH